MNIHIIGDKEKVIFPTLGSFEITAKVDTGADVSSIWCSYVKRFNDRLECVFFGPGNRCYTGRKVVFKKGEYKISRVHNSFGHNQRRYKVKIPVIINGRRILASFTLADRSKKTYYVLIGKRLLAKKFLVDVTGGKLLSEQTKQLGRAVSL
ncbi:MAG TPA: RimK/LysX family protein [Candidatus Saccharimonadales bacterium]|nr:RimK/LysX family protein [Candidatus Saccharimonadales bacterium]